MYKYPYSEEGVAEYLKEVCKTESPVVRGSMNFRGSSGEFGGKREITYHFRTEDGKKYEMVCKGFQTVELHEPLSEKATSIKSIILIEDNED